MCLPVILGVAALAVGASQVKAAKDQEKALKAEADRQKKLAEEERRESDIELRDDRKVDFAKRRAAGRSRYEPGSYAAGPSRSFFAGA